jgi:S-DNA-T family DNA segregation ATPase FtsK/SpoIIIE
LVDLATLPHLLIAGATGSGKSACINSIVASLLFTKAPDQVRLVMIDPKGVELTPFNGVPHLVSPVISDLVGFKGALEGLITVMQRRYKRMELLGTRNIGAYNTKAKRRMPYVALIVDELAELMIAGGREVEEDLVRLAQMGRAIGIHLVLATQRPTVDVVTGHLKANIPTRIAFAVASQTDSRVILDAIGAENLLGKGDMLLQEKGTVQPRRIQGTLLDDDEIRRLVEFWINPPQEEPQNDGEPAPLS